MNGSLPGGLRGKGVPRRSDITCKQMEVLNAIMLQEQPFICSGGLRGQVVGNEVGEAGRRGSGRPWQVTVESLTLILHAMGRHLKGFKQGSNSIKSCVRNKK